MKTTSHAIMPNELKDEITNILGKDIDPIFFKLASKIEPLIKEHHFMPWLLAYKMDRSSATVVLALPDENWTPEIGDFKCSNEFATKLGMEKSYVEEQLFTRYRSGEIMWGKKGGFVTLNSGFWMDLQNSKWWYKRNGTAYYKIMAFFVEQDVSAVSEISAEERVKEGKLGLARIIPRYDSVKDNPNLLPAENFKEILKSRDLIVNNQCACRIRYPELEQDASVCLCFNDTARWSLKMDIGDEISWEKAFDQVQASGKIIPHCHINKHTDNLNEIGDVLCSCHSDVCTVLKNASRLGTKYPVWEYYGKSRYLAKIDSSKCINCGLCKNKRCMFNAIDLRFDRDIMDNKYYVNPITCMGCGCCVETCPKGAIEMICVQPPEYLKGYKLENKEIKELQEERLTTLDL